MPEEGNFLNERLSNFKLQKLGLKLRETKLVLVFKSYFPAFWLISKMFPTYVLCKDWLNLISFFFKFYSYLQESTQHLYYKYYSLSDLNIVLRKH